MVKGHHRVNRRVVEFQFLIEGNANAAPGVLTDANELERIKSTEAFQKLTVLGAGDSLAATWIRQDPERALAAANHTDNNLSRKPIKSNVAGYVRSVFEGTPDSPQMQEKPAAPSPAAKLSEPSAEENERA